MFPRYGTDPRLIAWGSSNKETAAYLGISVKTVESYKAGAVAKLELRSRTDLVRYALAHGWLSEDNAPDRAAARMLSRWFCIPLRSAT